MAWRFLLLLFFAIPISGVAQDENTMVESMPEKSNFYSLRRKLKKNNIDTIEAAIVDNDFAVFSSFLHHKIDKSEVKKIFELIQKQLGERHWHLITHYAGERSLSVVERGYAGE